MSILLEALKKSEQQRQLGQTPTLQTPDPGVTRAQDEASRWVPLGLVVLSFCVMAWFGWQQFEQPFPEDMIAVAPDTGQRPGTVDAVAAVEPQARTMTESFQSEDEDANAAASSEPRADDGARARLNQSFNKFVADDKDADPAEPDSRQAATVEASSQPASELRRMQPRQSRAAPATTTPEPHVSEPISYWELPQGVRDDLPELKITVLVYANEPADRFVLVNGQRLTEAEELEGGVVLHEIRRDGIVFGFRKYRFLVKG